ncbi:hypothetical protein KAR48_15670 [bacterium]|nr:hypothetical protein [bacterium]
MRRFLCVFLLAGALFAQEKASISFTPYGFVKFETILDQNYVAKGDWLLFAPSGTDDNGGFTMNARHTRLGMRIDGPTFGEGGKIKGLVEFDFAGGFPNSGTAARQPIPRLRHAWVELSKGKMAMRFGQDWALISGPFPSTTSFVVGAGKGNLWMRFPQIKLTVGSGAVKAAFSINRPIAGNVKYDSFAGGDFDVVGDGERSGRPWLMSRFWYNCKKGGVSIMGHIGWEKIVNAAVVDPMTTSYSVAVEGRFKAGKVAFTGKGFTGKNLNSFLGGIFQGYRVSGDEIIGIRSQGGWAQAKVTFNPQWFATVGGGMEKINKDDLVDNMRSQNQWFFGNIGRKVTKHVTFMLEVEHLTTKYAELADGKNLRNMFVALFTF